MEAWKRKEYTVSELFSVIFARLWLILLCAAIGTAGAFLVTKYVIDEQYTASVSLHVSPQREGEPAAASLNDLYYAQNVVPTYIELLRTNSFMASVAKTSGLPYDPLELFEMVRIEAVNNTEIFKVQVTTPNPRHSLRLAYTIGQLAPQKILETKSSAAVTVVDVATLPTIPAGPNILLNTFIGLILGLALSVIGVVIRDMLDRRIKDQDDIVRHYSFPVLGSVPRFEK